MEQGGGVFAAYIEERHGVAGSAPAPAPVPAAAPARAPAGTLACADVLRPRDASAFAFERFNAMQSEVARLAYLGGDSLMVAAPTGSGKTVVADLALLRHLARPAASRGLAVYVAPLKALCQERVADWRARLPADGVEVHELTADSTFAALAAVSGGGGGGKACLLVATPEKLDAVTRGTSLAGRLGLLLVDEVHLVGCENRGACLEGVVTRLRLGSPAARVVALSAVVPNCADLARWLGARALTFGEEYRPVPLETHVIGEPDRGTNPFLFERSLAYRMAGVLAAHASGRPALIFCHSRASCGAFADRMVRDGVGVGGGLGARRDRLAAAAGRARDPALRRVLPSGVGIHHAGLDPADRAAAEALFRAGDLAALCATATLAQGVNLPCRLVVVAGTDTYRRGRGYTDATGADLLQMIGRAGRPGLDDRGVAVVVTRQGREAHFRAQLAGGGGPVGSHLLDGAAGFAGHVNAEVVLGTVRSEAGAERWARGTLAWALAEGGPEAGRQRLLRRVRAELASLASGGMIVRGPSEGVLAASRRGRLMARHCLRFETARAAASVPGDATLELLFCETVCGAREFRGGPDEQYAVRLGEKGPLNKANRAPGVRFKLRGRVQNGHDKVRVLLQAALSGQPPPPNQPGLGADTRAALTHAACVARFLADDLAGRVAEDGEAGVLGALGSALTLRQCLEAGQWETEPECRQLHGVGARLAGALSLRGGGRLASLAEWDARRICEAAGRRPPFGERVLAALARYPRLAVALDAAAGVVRVTAGPAVPGGAAAPPETAWHRRPAAVLVVGAPDNRVVLVRRIALPPVPAAGEWTFSLPAGAGDHRLTATVALDSVLGMGARACSGGEVASSQLPPPPPPQPSAAHGAAEPGAAGRCKHTYGLCLQGLCKHACCSKLADHRRVTPAASATTPTKPARAPRPRFDEAAFLRQKRSAPAMAAALGVGQPKRRQLSVTTPDSWAALIPAAAALPPPPAPAPEPLRGTNEAAPGALDFSIPFF